MRQGRTLGSPKGFRLTVVGMLLVIGAIMILVWRETRPQERTNAAAATPSAAVNGTQASQVVFVDPQTGLPREPTAAEMAALAAAKTTISAPAEPISIVGVDGTPGVILPEGSETTVVVTKNPDGTISLTHVTGKEEAEAAVKGAQAISTIQKEASGDR